MAVIPIRQQVRKAAAFFTGLLLFWAAGCAMLIRYSKADGFVLLRPNDGNVFADFLFRYGTHIGDGIFAVILVVFFLLQKKYINSFVLFFGYAVSGILAQAMKYTFESPRPSPHFRALGKIIREVDGVNLLQSHNSFPSGHTATAFALATAFVLVSSWWQKNWWLALLPAILIGYSRIYLGQHFLQDVLAGSVLGVFASIAGYILLQKWNPPFVNKE